MSAIFPTEPAKVRIHLLPKNSDMITYRISDVLEISAWMPDKFHRIEQKSKMTNDDFHAAFCDECSRNCYGFLEDYYDEDMDDTDWDHPDLNGHCDVYNDGYHGQHCPEGYTQKDTEVSFDVANMVFEIHLAHLGETPRFNVVKDTAYLQAGYFNTEDQQLEATQVRMASNVFGHSDAVEGICWGYNELPKNLREVVTYYMNSPFNNDLLPLDAFEQNCSLTRDDFLYGETHSDNVYPNETYFGTKLDAIMLLDAEEDIQAFYTMLMAGFKPLDKASHVMMIPLVESEIERNGNMYRGFTTTPDAVNHKWFVMNQDMNSGVLLGQL